MDAKRDTTGCGQDRSPIEACRFHPFEFAIAGFSGSGKTTLLEKLVPLLTPLRVGYLKHDAHRPDLDREGKDTFRLARAGCVQVGIGAEGMSGLLGAETVEPTEWKLRLAGNDVLLVEGFRDLDVPKILVLDAAGEAWADFVNGRFRAVEALVHAGDAPASDLPAFHRDDAEGIAAFLRARWAARVPRVRGLVLSGGRSERMGRDKASLSYRGRGEAERLFAILSELDLDPCVSRASGQEAPPGVPVQALLYDRFAGFGPLGGVLTALESDPRSAWLVVGCDLPLLGRRTLETLLAARDPYADATAFLDSDGRLPEPMCSLWEPKSRLRALQMLGLGYRCPRKVLIHGRTRLLASPGERILFNANTPADRVAALREIAEGSP